MFNRNGLAIFVALSGTLVFWIALSKLDPLYFMRWGQFLTVSCYFSGVVIGCILGQHYKSRSGRASASRIDTLRHSLVVGKTLYETDLCHPLRKWNPHKTYQRTEHLVVENGVIRFLNGVVTTDEWDYIYLDPKKYLWRDFSWRFSIKRDTSFREFAFNFRYQDFDNRYRYRFEDDKLFFDKKVRGEWTNNIASTPFPMELRTWYQARIDAYGSLFRCYVGDRMLLENVDTDLMSGSICVILWEDDGRTTIAASVGPMTVYALSMELSLPNKQRIL